MAIKRKYTKKKPMDDLETKEDAVVEATEAPAEVVETPAEVVAEAVAAGMCTNCQGKGRVSDTESCLVCNGTGQV